MAPPFVSIRTSSEPTVWHSDAFAQDLGTTITRDGSIGPATPVVLQPTLPGGNLYEIDETLDERPGGGGARTKPGPTEQGVDVPPSWGPFVMPAPLRIEPLPVLGPG